MIFCFYTANLFNYLKISRQPMPLGSMADLFQQNKVVFGAVGGGSTSAFFKKSDDPIYQLAWQKMIQAEPNSFVKSYSEGIERVEKSKGLYALLMETPSLEYTLGKNCNLRQFGEILGEKHFAFAIPKGSYYRSSLNRAILKLKEEGVLMKLKQKWWSNQDICPRTVHKSFMELKLNDLSSAFFVLWIGMLCAYVIGICEFLYGVKRSASKRKLTFCEVFKQELSFFVKIWIKKKTITENENNITEAPNQCDAEAHFITEEL
ncbi:glutamate receptor ionotropic, kainate 2-like isoform X2 [Condylostylus longicornis]|uniref:glutamate receptor ionotropic, kainate 2-like isoform X2 n=1 Tax=Condylostylus longicornis TaxID=2530218 RepID=UPI00244DA9D0|nr:glutamate receptor ionotropic, kainate 2-like isoform X2 [Condylostylus longicornis]